MEGDEGTGVCKPGRSGLLTSDVAQTTSCVTAAVGPCLPVNGSLSTSVNVTMPVEQRGKPWAHVEFGKCVCYYFFK